MDKKGFEFTFTWMFAIFVGGLILFIAIFTVSRIVTTGVFDANTRLSAELAVLLNPIETNLESSKAYTITFPQETRVFNTCRDDGTFGTQEIGTASKQSIGVAWPKPGVVSTFHNKYIFSASTVQGKEIKLFVKPFMMPYEIGDMIILYTGAYCFVNPPEEVREELEALALEGVNVTSSVSLCVKNATSVCFDSTGCTIQVDTDRNTVIKDRKTVYYTGSLLYGAIFSDGGIYTCQVTRLLHRASELAYLYSSKSEFTSSTTCATSLGQELGLYAQELAHASPASLDVLGRTAAALDTKNEHVTCPLF